jgi:hypothetical protein
MPRDLPALTSNQLLMLYSAGRTIAEHPVTTHDLKWATLITALQALEEALDVAPAQRLPPLSAEDRNALKAELAAQHQPGPGLLLRPDGGTPFDLTQWKPLARGDGT